MNEWVIAASAWLSGASSMWMWQHVRRIKWDSLHATLAGPGEPRCACGRYWVPRDFHAIRDDYGKHDPYRCQPEGELL